MTTQKNTALYNRHVEGYKERFMKLGKYERSFDILMNYLRPDATVLEFGCGPGNVAKYLKSKRPDLEITGIDIALEMVKEAQELNADCNFREMDIIQAGNLEQTFHAVIAPFSLPYLERADAHFLFSNANSLLTANGIFYISCMEGPAARSGYEKTSFTGDDEMFINYYERNEIERLLTEYKFRKMEFFTEEYQEMDGTVTTDLFFIAKKK